MATIEHKGSYTNGSVVVYTGYGTNYGYSLVKEVYIEAIGEYRWIAEPVKIVNNEAVKYTNGSLELLSGKYINDEYKSLWKKDPVHKKGDILLGKDNMVFVYISDSHVERLTPRKDMPSLGTNDRQGYSSLSDYEANFGPLVKAVPAHPYTSSF